MLHFARRSTVHRSSFRHSRRLQLGGGLLFAVLLPWLVRTGFGIETTEVLQRSGIGNLVAVLLGYYMYRSLTVFPGIRAGYFILPSFFISYTAVLLVFLAMREDYSRFLFIAGFLASIIWYYAIFFLTQRDRSLRIGVVPFGEVVSLKQIDRIEWVPLDRPDGALPKYDALAADFRADLPDEWERFLADSALSGIIVYHVKQLRESLTGRVEIEHLSENNFGSLVPALMYIKLKEVLDFTSALLLGVLLLPLLLIVTVAVKLDSPGPAFFRQRRIGYGGRHFVVFKFRTMLHRDGDAGDLSESITQSGDPRVTRLGRFLRRTRIDELPQIINILRGEMSWIGPRPEAEVLSRWYEAELPFYRYRHIVKPGITGWAQVNQGHVAEVHDVLWKLQYDFYYIKNFSPWLDVLIAFKTVQTVLTGFGSR